MILNDVHRGITKHRPTKRLGRGTGSGQGKTAGRGHKGAKSRSGYAARQGFEGGQMPIFRRVAKRGFNNKQFATLVKVVNVSTLEAIFENGASIDPATLEQHGLIRGKYEELKILGNGDLTKKLNVKAHQFSKSAEEKITQAGGTVERILFS
ncbi:MAG: 50S ribosomal protein L15 [Planctomycetota bacterium]|nr:50S ribosomal protein L15 [Planctomycetota bacterium]MDA1213220.1 50S ribosomal protein L15 [Planctomycetota bacterium]